MDEASPFCIACRLIRSKLDKMIREEIEMLLRILPNPEANLGYWRSAMRRNAAAAILSGLSWLFDELLPEVKAKPISVR